MTGSDRERDVLAGVIRAVTDQWLWSLDEVHDVPQIVNAVLASDWLAAHDKAVAATAWDEGRRTGASRAMRHMSDEPDLPLATAADNPYRDLARCPVTVYAGPPAPGRHATRPCGEPVALWGLCTRHLADHARLCPGGCERCGR